jgi:hypothetical protein
MQAVAAAAGDMGDATRARARAALAQRRTPDEADIAALIREFDGLPHG